MNLSKEAIKKLQAVAKAILAEPELYDQDHWPWAKDTCTTPCCISGWLRWLENPNPKAYKKFISQRTYRSFRDISQILGVDESFTQRLFCTAEGWPAKFHYAFKKATTDKGRATAAANYIKYFIKKDGEV